MTEDGKKSLHGSLTGKSLEQVIKHLFSVGYIKDYDKHYYVAFDKSKQKQFHYKFRITFFDDKKWIVHSTSSIRTDRIKIQQFDAYFIKKENKDVEKAYVIYPTSNSEKEKKLAIDYNQQIVDKKIYSPIDNVLDSSDFLYKVEEKALSAFDVGLRKSKEGVNFEKLVVFILNMQNNLEKWNGKDIESGFKYDLFSAILIEFKIKGKIDKIEAKQLIDKLPSGGNPKTDIYIEITQGKTLNVFTVSCKRSSSKQVQLHEYDASKFIKTLNITEVELQDAIIEFQSKGNVGSMSTKSRDAIEKLMPKYNRQLALWVIGGIGGDGDPKIHWANYVLTFNNNTTKYRICSVQEYVNEMLENKNGTFGSPFYWTYASKKRGKGIKLKGNFL